MAVLHDEVTFGGHAFGRMNLARLIALTRDDDPANRDWATFLLAQTEEDGDDVRRALLERTTDQHRDIRHEAIEGLVARDRQGALPLVKAELAEPVVRSMVLEAAAVVGDPPLLPVPDEIAAGWRDDGPDDVTRKQLGAARRACATGVPEHWLTAPDQAARAGKRSRGAWPVAAPFFVSSRRRA